MKLNKNVVCASIIVISILGQTLSVSAQSVRFDANKVDHSTKEIVSEFNRLDENKIKADFEDKIKEEGFEIAKERGLLMSQEEAENMTYEMNNCSSVQEKEEITNKYKKYQLSQEEIIDNSPKLKEEAQLIIDENSELTNNISSSDTLVKAMAVGNSFRDWDLVTSYSYTEQTTNDTRTAKDYSKLSEITIGIISCGLKPAASIAVSVLQAVTGSSATACKNYEMKSSYHDCTTTRSVEINTPSYFGSSVCLDYAYAFRVDRYAKMQVDAWNGNVFYTNSKTAKVHYRYAYYFSNTSPMINIALAQYDYLMKNKYTYNTGIAGYVIPDSYFSDDVRWTSSDSNPFN